ncbi:exonuclease SbcCD subunit D [Verrucosispora sp. WMMA2044]|uniref:Nuclease SbcCD subunit D n=1 Tax=Verrucosispora sioxanthis TaxID=2499994 RepID=A0A6M1KRK3_9ACTN|nr:MULTISPECIES: exonuclease SbcCD subunit D [Micromonospora]NEE62535.1 exonuclease SbcCD subunit D [Verrucosispora sioxanthis]NGM11645.1 exonuclease SbcCD subunit D [Verrucosispora sioxanthis]WBB46897.1 exonuclease SbcCD subunit D [Verrucosispora sp. WMMA2044]
MKILHTSDWHVGKVLKGQSRAEEHKQVLAGVIEIARRERPDLVVIAGDLYDTAAPTPEATRLVTRALTALRRTGADVVAIGGNHDNGPALDALRPWAEAAGITLRGGVREDPAEHVIDGTTADGERWRLAALPFLSQRYAVRAVEMYELTAAESTQTYADHLGRILARLTEGFDEPDRVHLVTAHLTVVGAATGGGERDAHTIMGYAVPASVFPGTAHYVALGHLHRAQRVQGPCPIRYSGAPLAVDFGEQENVPAVTLVEVTATTAARIREEPVTAATALRTVRGTLAQLAEITPPEGWLRVYVREQPRAGLREEVQQLLPRALEIRIDPELVPAPGSGTRVAQRSGRSPRQLFADYLDSRGHADEGVRELFDELLEEVDH